MTGNFARWMYHDGRPNLLARIMNRASAIVFARGIARDYLVTLEVAGRRSGRLISLPLVMVVVGGQRYLASMLGGNAAWVRTSGQPVARPSFDMAGAKRSAWKRSPRSSARPS
jgi:hypothetical protein